MAARRVPFGSGQLVRLPGGALLADNCDPEAMEVGEVASRELRTLSPNDSVEEAVSLMREAAVRRAPVVQDGEVVGIVSLGDLAREQDSRSALGQISAAPSNR